MQEQLTQNKITQAVSVSVFGYLGLLALGFIMAPWKLPELGLLFSQVGIVLSFFFVYKYSINLKEKDIKTNIFLFQSFWVIFSYIFYISAYGTPLGYMAADAYVYNKYAIIAQDLNLSEFLEKLKVEKNFNYSDWGFFVFLKYIYILPGWDIFNMKIINILLNYGSVLIVYKISKWITTPFLSKNILILCGLSPITIYFSSTGLKEVLFLFIVVLAFYLVYKYVVYRKAVDLLAGAAIAILIIFFRPLVFMFFVSGWAVYFFFSSKGQNKIVYQILMSLFFVVMAIFIYRMLQDEIQYYLQLDTESLAGDRYNSDSIGTVESTQFSLINRIAGFFGPLPTILQLGGKDIEISQSMGVIFKAILSIFNIYCIIIVVFKRVKLLYPIAVFIFLNVLMMVFSSSSLDMRIHYPYYFLFIITSVLGLRQMVLDRRYWIAIWYYVGIIAAAFLWNQRG